MGKGFLMKSYKNKTALLTRCTMSAYNEDTTRESNSTKSLKYM
jgi:hypothetical protein